MERNVGGGTVRSRKMELSIVHWELRNLLAQIFLVLVTDRAEILRDRLEERQDPSF